MENKQENNRAWYVYTTDATTIEAILSRLNPRPSPFCSHWVEDIEHIGGRKFEVKMNLSKLNSCEQINELRNGHQNSHPSFRVYVQDNPGERIYRWPEDESLIRVN
jgi:hypothetical protein